MYGHLRAFEAGGGGDTPESVNEALDEAIHKMKWSDDRAVLKIIFLEGPKYPELCRAAAKKDLIINTVQCGAMTETTPIWKEIAKMSEGNYVAIAQSGNVAIIATPMDEKLAELNKRIGATLIPYGDPETRGGVSAKQAMSEAVAAPAAADRLSYNAKTNKSVQGAGELLDALTSNSLKLEDIRTKDLPPELQKLSREELEARIAQAGKDRAALQKEIAEVAQKREAFIAEENKRLAAAGKGDSFDTEVVQTIRKQAERKGIHY